MMLTATQNKALMGEWFVNTELKKDLKTSVNGLNLWQNLKIFLEGLKKPRYKHQSQLSISKP